MESTHCRRSKPLGHSCAPCSRPCRDLAGAQPFCSSPEVSLRETRSRPEPNRWVGAGGGRGRKDLTVEDGSLPRFGRNARGSWSSEQLSPRAREGLSSPFWSLAAPQRFGKK